MTINNFLLHEIYNNKYQDYSFNFNGMERFLESKMEFVDRQKLAIELIKGIVIEHGKKEVLNCVVELARVEQGMQELEPWLRDHVVHALLCYVLGAVINEKYLKPNGIKINKLQWKISCLFHDVGYPVQAARNIGKQYSENVNSISKTIGVPTDEVYFKTVPINLENLQNNKNSLNLIQMVLDSWGLEINAIKEFNENINSGRVCHGMISSLSVLKIIDLLYQKNNPERKFEETEVYGVDWNQQWFTDDIIPSCTAIFCHNLPPKCFIKTKIERHKAPLAFLLKLTDCLQEWERPSKENKEGYLGTDFNICIENNKIILLANIPEDRKLKIYSELRDTLVAPDIRII